MYVEVLMCVWDVERHEIENMSRSCFAPVCFVFFFNAPYQFTLLLNLFPLIFGLMFFGWFVSIYCSSFFIGVSCLI